MDRYLVIDLETNTVEKFGRKANPWFNEIVAVGIAKDGEAAAKYVFGEEFKEIDLTDIDVIVGHNIGFDLQYLWKYDWLQAYFKRGGKVFCSQLCEYILSGQECKYPALRDIAVNKYGCPDREKLMEPYWDRGVQTSDIPKELVLEDVKNDVLDTEQVYLQQLVLAEKQGQTKLIELQNDALLATLECTMNGIRIDLNTLQRNKLELQQKLEQKQKELEELIRPWWYV